MPKKQPEHSNRGPIIALTALIILAVIGAGVYYWQGTKSEKGYEPANLTESSVKPPGEKPFQETGKIPTDKTDQKVLDYNRLEEDKELQALIRERKEAFGIDDAVDMIVSSDESVKVGDSTVPMREILDKIRIKRGEVEEEDIGEKPKTRTPEETKKDLDEKVQETRERMVALEKQLQAPETDEQTRTEIEKERQELGKILAAHDKYTRIIDRIDQIRKKMPSGTEEQKAEAQKTIEELTNAREKLEEALVQRLLPNKKIDAFGIHVVRQGDNIWNIHFKFLRQYFENRGVKLSSSADEPDKKGYSSGIGKVLKFSEKMVYIYNVRERRLDVNLDMIHPMSKIVVFHMDEIFSQLDQIDYSQLKEIRFDGENIWIPAEN